MFAFSYWRVLSFLICLSRVNVFQTLLQNGREGFPAAATDDVSDVVSPTKARLMLPVSLFPCVS